MRPIPDASPPHSAAEDRRVQRRRSAGAGGLRGLLTMLAVLAAASPAAPQSPPIYGETIEVRVVNVEVVVTDREGRRVEGLPPSAFRLSVDGRDVTIDYFSEIREGLLTEPPENEGTPVPAPALGPETGERVPTRYLVFIDDLFTVGAQRDVVLGRLAEQVDLLGPGDAMAVVAFDGRRLEMLADWAAGREALRQALLAARERPAGGVFRRSERRMFGPGSVSGEGRELEREAAARALAARTAAQIDRVTGAAAAAMRATGGPAGRKAMLLLSGGWPYELLAGENFAEGRPTDGGDRARFALEGASLYRRLVDTANLLGYTLYPVDVPGLGGSGEIAEEPGPVDEAPRPSSAFDGGDSTLLYLARETGGRAMLNSLRTRALERAVEDTRSYYWLGFTVGRRADGLRHDVRVDVDPPGLRARARRDFVDLTRQSEARMLVEASLYVPERRGEGELAIAVGEPERRRGRQIEVPVRIGIPTDSLTFLPRDGAWIAAIEVTFGVMDRADAVSEIRTLEANLELPRPPAPGAGATYSLSLELRRQRHDLAVTILDLPSGALLSGSAVVDP